MHKSYSNPDVSFYDVGLVAQTTRHHGSESCEQQDGGKTFRSGRSRSRSKKYQTSSDLTKIVEHTSHGWKNSEDVQEENIDTNSKDVRVKRRIIRRSHHHQQQQQQQQQQLSRSRRTEALGRHQQQLTQASKGNARSPDALLQRTCSSDDDDDVSSICSDPCAVMSRSLDAVLEGEEVDGSKKFFRKKKMKRIRRSCPVHGKQHLLKKYGEDAKRMPQYSSLFSLPNDTKLTSSASLSNLPHLLDIKVGDVLTIDTSLPVVQEEQKSECCTCDRVKKHSGSRLKLEKQSAVITRSNTSEREGGHCVISQDMSEFHKLIYENEPIFSDTEINEELDKQIREESDRYHKRSTQLSKNIFASALCYNSSTMMKLAIIQNEIRNLQEGYLQLVSLFHN